MSRAKLIALLLWLLALVLAAWTFRQLPLEAIGDSIANLGPGQWLLWIVLNGLIIALLTWRWNVLTNLLQVPVSFVQLLLIRQAGQAISFITPGPQFGGEPLQIWWLHKQGKQPLHKSVLALVLDRFFELWVNFSVLLVCVLILASSRTMPLAQWREITLALTVAVTALSLSGWILLHQPRWLSSRMEKLAQHWQQHPRLRHIDSHWQAIGSELRQIVSCAKPVLCKALLLSLAGWTGMLLEIALLLDFVGIQASLPDFMLVLVAMRLALLLPLPGGIGTVEAALFWAFQLLNFPAAAAVGFIALLRLRDAVVLAAGLWCLRAMQTRS